MLSVIAIADCDKFTNDSHNLVFGRGSYRRKDKLHMICYDDNVPPMQIIKHKCECCGHQLKNYEVVNFNETEYPEDLNPLIRNELESLRDSYRYMTFIDFHQYTIWYHIRCTSNMATPLQISLS